MHQGNVVNGLGRITHLPSAHALSHPPPLTRLPSCVKTRDSLRGNYTPGRPGRPLQSVATRWYCVVIIFVATKIEESARAMAAEGKTKALTTSPS